MKKVIVFDVIETLLDLKALKLGFADLLGHPDSLDRWFALLIQSALVADTTGHYANFGAIARHAFGMIAARQGKTVSDADAVAALSGLARLPAHPDCAPALQRLSDAGFRLATLTNSTVAVAQAQLTHAGLSKFFEQVISVDSVRRFKPSAEVYRMAASALGVPLGSIRLVAAHDWDVTGAIRAGTTAAFVARPGMVLGALSERPDIVGPDLTNVSQQIMDRDR